MSNPLQGCPPSTSATLNGTAQLLEVEKTFPTETPQPDITRHISRSSTHTFLLMLIYFQLPLLLQSQGVDDGNSQSESFSGIAMGTQCIHPSTGCGDVFCKARNRGMAEPEEHRMVLMGLLLLIFPPTRAKLLLPVLNSSLSPCSWKGCLPGILTGLLPHSTHRSHVNT